MTFYSAVFAVLGFYIMGIFKVRYDGLGGTCRRLVQYDEENLRYLVGVIYISVTFVDG